MSTDTQYNGHMDLRIPETLAHQLAAIAEAQNTSTDVLLLQAAEMLVERHERTLENDAALDHILAKDAQLLERLADA